jgi:acetate---CoA ligase (ADP-forming)
LCDDTWARLAEILPAAATREQREGMVFVDRPSTYRASVESVLADRGVDAVLVIYMPNEFARSADVVASIGEAVAASRARGITDKPVLVCTATRKRRAAPIKAGDERLPAYLFPENAVRALGKIAAYADWRRESS